jgi:peptide alpha-N-acetyltransferase
VNGDPDTAVGILDSYFGTLDDDCVEFQKNFESSELALYKNLLLSETKGEDDDGLGGVRKALVHLDEIANVIVDQTGWLQTKLSYQLQLGNFEDAKDTVFKLFQRGLTEDHRVHGAYMCALLKCDRETCLEVQKMKGTGTLATLRSLSEEERGVLLDAYGNSTMKDGSKDGLTKLFSRSNGIKRIYFTLLPTNSEEFKSAVDKYCQKQITKGVPSLGADLSALYLMGESHSNNRRLMLVTDPLDVKGHPVHAILVDLIDEYIVSLSSNNSFPNGDGVSPPSALLWAWYLRSILHEQVAEYTQGITLVNKCIEHTPTVVDFYELKARLLEAGGDIQQAADVIDAGRDLDHQDRYINNQTTKTLLRAGREEDAKKRIALFCREQGAPEQYLYDMQCSWFELELADSCRRTGEFGRSLRKYMAVVRHYEDYHEDQFDFHSYCIRKVTMRSYCDLLRFEDDIWGLPYYGRAAEEIVKIYLYLHDNPSALESDAEPDYSNMTPVERKKAKNIARKKKNAAGKGGSDSKSDTKSINTNGGSGNVKKGKPHAIDEDPEGKELLALNHLDEAKKYAAILARHAPKSTQSWALQYDASVRRGKMLMGLQALFKMKSFDSSSHQLFSRIVDFSQRLESRSSKCHDASEEIISKEFPKLMDGNSLSEFVKLAVDRVKNDTVSDLPMRTAVAKAILSSGFGRATDSVSLILDSKLKCRGVNVDSCREALKFIESVGDEGGESQLKTLILTKFPFFKDF